MKVLRKGTKRIIRTTLAEDELLYEAKAVTSDFVIRYRVDKNGFSLYWFEDELTMHCWILGYSKELMSK